uniref:CSON013704 protein n=1 Tax=Culicoides sonorensis TaxID=179676 RepID=A0A336LUP5_CULSO
MFLFFSFQIKMVNDFLSSNDSMNLLTVPSNNKRKFSFPMQLHSSALLGDSPVISTRRRLSNVGDIFGRKLSSTIGWKQPIPTQDIITQGKCLCGQYIKTKLKRTGIFNRKLGLQRIRSIVGTPSIHVVREVFPAISCLTEELERMHPRLYCGVTRQITRTATGDLPNAETACVLISAIARNLFLNGVTWAKIISLFCIVGGLSVDCVKQNHIDYLPKLVDALGEVIEDELVNFIHEHGGWIGLCQEVMPETTELKLVEWLILAFISILIVFCFILVIKFSYYLIFTNSP